MPKRKKRVPNMFENKKINFKRTNKFRFSMIKMHDIFHIFLKLLLQHDWFTSKDLKYFVNLI